MVDFQHTPGEAAALDPISAALRLKKRGLRTAIAAKGLLLALQLGAAFVCDSLALWAVVMLSFIDAVGMIFAFWMVSVSARPADYEHNYGYGKFENLCAMTIAYLLIAITGYHIYHAGHKLLHPTVLPQYLWVAVVMAATSLTNRWISRRLHAVVHQAPSPSIEYSAEHMGMASLIDGAAAVAIFASGLADQMLGRHALVVAVGARFDPVIGVILGLRVVRGAVGVIRESLNVLLDRALPEDMQMVILNALARFDDNYCELGKVRSRRSGNQIFVEVEVMLPAELNLSDATAKAQRLAQALAKELRDAEVTVYPIPCPRDCAFTRKNAPCPYAAAG